MEYPAASATLTIYRRDGCTICDEAEDLLNEELDARRAAGRPVPAIERVDVHSSADLEERYGPRIPVFAIGRHELDLVVTPGRLRRLLDDAGADQREAEAAWT
jgi:glutaredoxin